MKSLLITGANGQLGTELSKLLPAAILTDYQDLDITNKSAVDNFVEKYKVETIVNCAAYTAVDAAEDDFDKASKINVDGPRNLAQTGRKLIHISTDYVFDGSASEPYTPQSPVWPLSVYGDTKLQGEVAVLENNPTHSVIIRTQWLYSPYGKNFVKTMRNLGASRKEITVVADQFGKPTYAADLAVAIAQVIPQMKTENAGVYHYSNSCDAADAIRGISWCDFATEIMKQSNLDCAVKPITTDEYPTRAVRPRYSVLDTNKIQQTFGIKIPVWKDALHRCINEIERR